MIRLVFGLSFSHTFYLVMLFFFFYFVLFLEKVVVIVSPTKTIEKYYLSYLLKNQAKLKLFRIKTAYKMTQKVLTV